VQTLGLLYSARKSALIESELNGLLAYWEVANYRIVLSSTCRQVRCCQSRSVWGVVKV
jgi:hypothetical protein